MTSLKFETEIDYLRGGSSNYDSTETITWLFKQTNKRNKLSGRVAVYNDKV